MFTKQVTIKPVSPFSFELSARIFSGGDRQTRIYEDSQFAQLVRINGKLIHIVLTSKGTVNKPELTL